MFFLGKSARALAVITQRQLKLHLKLWSHGHVSVRSFRHCGQFATRIKGGWSHGCVSMAEESAVLRSVFKTIMETKRD